ncbi:hypothetical protein D0Z70_01190 [Sphingobium terrigena]|uniref:Uncharacterized protein n=1 Tax=Sphingobium terrigena TaxID=2304063 RepID=A0A418YYB6_9SPHN|nr:hypothetical protein [Sphingobium terrigena]RJG57860.1 hypothetical protein D0Z70_01190 [Sphingobium terrigena]
MASDPNIQGNSHAAAPRSLGIGNRNSNPAQWAPFAWDDPLFGPQVKGEVAPVAFDHTSGSLQLGFWRTGKDRRHRSTCPARCCAPAIQGRCFQPNISSGTIN